MSGRCKPFGFLFSTSILDARDRDPRQNPRTSSRTRAVGCKTDSGSLGVRFCLLDTGVGGHIENLIVIGYGFILGYVYIVVSEFCVDGPFTAGEETECCPFWS